MDDEQSPPRGPAPILLCADMSGFALRYSLRGLTGLRLGQRDNLRGYRDRFFHASKQVEVSIS